MNNKVLHWSDISFSCIAKYLLRHAWMIVAFALTMAMGISLYFTWSHVPVYRANMTYAVTSRKTSFASGSNTAAAQEVTAVMEEMMGTGMVLNSVRESSPELENFSGTISAALVGESNFIVLSVTDESPYIAVRALQSLQTVFPVVTGYLSSSSIVQLVRNPTVEGPVNAVNLARYALLGGILGGGAMALLLCWIALRQRTVQTRSAARHLLKAPVVASICLERKHYRRKARNAERKSLQVFAPAVSFAYTEQVNAVCTRLEQEIAQGCKTFLVAGVSENEGKTTVAGNLAAALAMRGLRVALVDCDLRHPSLKKFFDNTYAAEVPLNQLLSQPFTEENFRRCALRHERLGMYMLFPHQSDSRSTELLTGQTMGVLLEKLRRFDVVILDTPPMGYFADVEALAERVDASLLVVRQDITPARDINAACELLRASGSRFLGVVLNGMTSSVTEGYGYGYGYGYGRGYGYGKRRKNKYGYGHNYGYGYGYGFEQSGSKKKNSGSEPGKGG